MELKSSPVILIVEDDKDDRILLKESFIENNINVPLFFLKDADELFDFLNIRGDYATNESAGLPDLILLDLNLPRKDGKEVLKELKQDPVFQTIPVVIFSTSNSSHDINACYAIGVNAYITKPSTFKELVETVGKVAGFWIDLVQYKEKPKKL